MHRHVAVTLVMLTACGAKQPAPAGGGEVAPDAAPAVVQAPPDAAPPPEVPPQDYSDDAASLRAAIKATTDPKAQLILFGHLARAEWAATCAAPTDGLCFQAVARAKKAPPTCDGHIADVKVTPRPGTLVSEVSKLIGEVRQRWGDGSAMHEITDEAAQADAYVQNTYMAEEVGGVLIILGNIEAEAMLAVPRLTGLDFDPDHGGMSERSAKKLQDWFKAVLTHGKAAMELYTLVAGDPVLQKWAKHAVIEAMARAAVLQQWAARLVRGLDLPASIAKDPDLVDAYCGALEDKAAPVEAAAGEAWAQCAAASEALGIDDGWSAICAAQKPPAL